LVMSKVIPIKPGVNSDDPLGNDFAEAIRAAKAHKAAKGFYLITWDDKYETTLSFRNKSVMPTDCIPEFVKERIRRAMEIRDFKPGGTA